MHAVRRWAARLTFLLALSTLAADPSDFTLKKVADGVYAAVAIPGGKAGSNSGFIVGGNGVMVIDTFLSPAPAAALQIGRAHV